jgi:hypothetical protein
VPNNFVVVPIASAAGGEMTGIHDSHAEKAVDEDDRDLEDSASPRKQQDGKRTAGAKKKKRTKKSGKQSSHEPSLKWRTLGLTAEDIEIPTMQRNVRTGKAQAQDDVAQRHYDEEDQDFSSSESEYTSEEESQEKRQDNGMFL